jgi:hypothetical protein
MRATSRKHGTATGDAHAKIPMDPTARRFAARHRLRQALALTDRQFHHVFGPDAVYRLFLDEFVDYAPGEDQRFLNFQIQFSGPGPEFHERFHCLLDLWSPAIGARVWDRLVITFRIQ